MENTCILKTNNLMKIFRQGEEYIYAVNRVNIEIPFAAITAIVGQSGSGKSTLLHLLAGLDNPSGGSVEVRTDDGKIWDLYGMKTGDLTAFRGQHFGFVFQNYELLPVLTAMENILIPCIYGGVPFEKKWFEKLVDILGISHRLHHLPGEMSGGEQQRVAVARALIHRPRVLFADEPTGNLDTENAKSLLSLLTHMRDEFHQTIVMVTHDPQIASAADQCLRIRDGVIIP